MTEVYFYEDIFHIQTDTAFYKESINYKFTEDIDILSIYSLPTSDIFGAFTDIKINKLRVIYPQFACELIKHVKINKLHISERLTDLQCSPVMSLENFIMIQSIEDKSIRIELTMGDVPGLTSEHFTNPDILYIVGTLNEATTRLVFENVKNIIYVSSQFSLTGIDCKLDNLHIYDGDIIIEMLDNISTKTLKISYVDTDIQQNMLVIDGLSRWNIQNIILKQADSSDEDIVDINGILKNSSVESLRLLGCGARYKTKTLLANTTIKKLEITGDKCNQELITEVCETNKNRVRYLKTKSARNYVE